MGKHIEVDKKPIALYGHERAITQIKYNREGDLLFSCAKDNSPNVWYSVNGERLGSFQGHNGAVWCLDVNWDSSKVFTGSSDNTAKLWDCETGKELSSITTLSAVRTCGFSFSGNMLMLTTDAAMKQICQLKVFDIRDSSQMRDNNPMKVIDMASSKATAAVWRPLEKGFITGHEDGSVMQLDFENGEALKVNHKHSNQINDIQISADSTMFVTSSKDTSSKLFDMYTLDLRKTYKTDRPVNSASISPVQLHVVLGGGQEAMDVTSTSTKGKFESRFYHMVFEEEFGRVKGHFGPINSVAFHPAGNGFSSGGEDGYVRMHVFDKTYYDFEYEY